MALNVLQSWNNKWPEVRSTKPLVTGLGVIDDSTFNTIEVDQVFDSINTASTIVGQSVLYRSLTNPSFDLQEINSKQEAVKEIQENQQLKAELEKIITHSAAKEQNLYILLYGKFLGAMSDSGNVKGRHDIEGYGYSQYRRGVGFLIELTESIKCISEPKSPYLIEVFDKINVFSETRVFSLMSGPVYNTENGLQSKQQHQGSFVPFTLFKPYIFKPLLISLLLVSIWVVLQFIPDSMMGSSSSSGATWVFFLAPLLLFYFPIIGSYDRNNCIIPLREQYRDSSELGDALDALGEIDELLVFIKFSEIYGNTTVLPTMFERDCHSIVLEDVKNPILGLQNQDYVGNDFVLDKHKLAFITGPNSGGKTAFCKTVAQVQLLAQIGCFIPAQAAKLSVADKIFYQAPDHSHLADGEGRFGTELKRTKNIFLSTTGKSLVILDELSEGTTFEEKIESSTNVLDGFYRKGCNTLLITHNHQLVDVFIDKRIGIAKQVEFAKDQPTYKLISGISRVSHADRVAKKIGFSKEDIDNYLAGAEE